MCTPPRPALMRAASALVATRATSPRAPSDTSRIRQPSHRRSSNGASDGEVPEAGRWWLSRSTRILNFNILRSSKIACAGLQDCEHSSARTALACSNTAQKRPQCRLTARPH